MRILACLMIFLGLSACTTVPSTGAESGSGETTISTRTLVVGDSMMAWNRIIGRSIPQVFAKESGHTVTNRSVVAAPLTGAVFDVRSQARGDDWDWILVNGAANDFLFGCGCRACDADLDEMLDADGKSGELADFLLKLRATGAKVVMVGYHRPRGLNSPYRRCRDELDVLDVRVAKFVARHDGIYFANMQDVYPPNSPSHYAFDHTHPSVKGSRVFGVELARQIETFN